MVSWSKVKYVWHTDTVTFTFIVLDMFNLGGMHFNIYIYGGIACACLCVYAYIYSHTYTHLYMYYVLMKAKKWMKQKIPVVGSICWPQKVVQETCTSPPSISHIPSLSFYLSPSMYLYPLSLSLPFSQFLPPSLSLSQLSPLSSLSLYLLSFLHQHEETSLKSDRESQSMIWTQK